MLFFFILSIILFSISNNQTRLIFPEAYCSFPYLCASLMNLNFPIRVIVS